MSIKDCTKLFEDKIQKNKIDRAIKNFDNMSIEEFEKQCNVVSAGNGEVGDPDYYKIKYMKEDDLHKEVEEDDFNFNQLEDEDLL